VEPAAAREGSQPATRQSATRQSATTQAEQQVLDELMRRDDVAAAPESDPNLFETSPEEEPMTMAASAGNGTRTNGTPQPVIDDLDIPPVLRRYRRHVQ
jgi:hypothetical protein